MFVSVGKNQLIFMLQMDHSTICSIYHTVTYKVLKGQFTPRTQMHSYMLS